MAIFFIVFTIQEWHFEYRILSNNDLMKREFHPLLFYSPDGNFLIIIEQDFSISIPQDSPFSKFDYISCSKTTGSIRVSGIGKQRIYSSRDKRFGYNYSFLSPSSQLIVKMDHDEKVFNISKNLKKIVVDDDEFNLDRNNTLVLQISKDGNIVRINSFSEEFGFSLDEALQNPILLYKHWCD